MWNLVSLSEFSSRQTHVHLHWAHSSYKQAHFRSAGNFSCSVACQAHIILAAILKVSPKQVAKQAYFDPSWKQPTSQQNFRPGRTSAPGKNSVPSLHGLKLRGYLLVVPSHLGPRCHARSIRSHEHDFAQCSLSGRKQTPTRCVLVRPLNRFIPSIRFRSLNPLPTASLLCPGLPS